MREGLPDGTVGLLAHLGHGLGDLGSVGGEAGGVAGLDLVGKLLARGRHGLGIGLHLLDGLEDLEAHDAAGHDNDRENRKHDLEREVLVVVAMVVMAAGGVAAGVTRVVARGHGREAVVHAHAVCGLGVGDVVGGSVGVGASAAAAREVGAAVRVGVRAGKVAARVRAVGGVAGVGAVCGVIARAIARVAGAVARLACAIARVGRAVACIRRGVGAIDRAIGAIPLVPDRVEELLLSLVVRTIATRLGGIAVAEVLGAHGHPLTRTTRTRDEAGPCGRSRRT